MPCTRPGLPAARLAPEVDPEYERRTDLTPRAVRDGEQC